MSRNSIEKRSTLLQKSWLNRSRCNPQSATSIAIPSSLLSKHQKYQESSASIRNFNPDPNSLEGRYEALQKMYKSLMLKVNIQNKNVGDQEKEKRKLEQLHEKNQKQIKMLRGMLGFLEKKDKGCQTEGFEIPRGQNDESLIGSCTRISKYCNFQSKDNTKIINNKKNENIDTRIEKEEFKNMVGKSKQKYYNQLVASRSAKYIMNEPINENQCRKQQRGLSPQVIKNKYKFIPSLPLC